MRYELSMCSNMCWFCSFQRNHQKKSMNTYAEALLPPGWHLINRFEPVVDVSFVEWLNNLMHLKFMGNFIPKGFSKVTFGEYVIISFWFTVAQSGSRITGSVLFHENVGSWSFPLERKPCKKITFGLSSCCPNRERFKVVRCP
jgi:hypothetical protein